MPARSRVRLRTPWAVCQNPAHVAVEGETLSRASRSVAVWVVLAATALKIYLAATTFGTNDVAYWCLRLRRRPCRPIRVYGEQFLEPYNHMPLAGWMLVLFNALTGLGPDLGFWIRLTASLADVVTAYLVFNWCGSTAPTARQPSRRPQLRRAR